MKTIFVAKSGSPFYARDGAGGNAKGEQGETEGIIRHLIDRGDLSIVYFGQYRGEPIPGIAAILEPEIEDLDHNSTAAMQKKYWEMDFLQAKEFDPIGVINVAGYSPTFSCIDNPNYATVQAAAVRYHAPVLSVIHKLDVPRVVVNCDPRTYPKGQEMSLMWKNVRPMALLDQCASEKFQTVGRRRYRRISHYAACESWGWIPQGVENLHRLHEGVVLGHSHVCSGIGTGDPNVWRQVLSSKVWPIWGNGWEWAVEEDLIERGRWQGCARPDEVLEILGDAYYCPVVAHTPGFYTGKPYVCVSQGCVPVLHAMYPSMGVPDVRYIWPNLPPWEEALTWWRKRCQPNWTELDLVVDHLKSGSLRPGMYGGYLPS